MREIKFEYGFESVNGIVKKVYHLYEIPNIHKICDVWNVLPIKYVRQYTGLKDSEGFEIWEGDKILPLGSFEDRLIVKWSDELSAFVAVNESVGYSQLLHIELELDDYKVTGNIHE